jgi:hypothetical protein
VRNTHTHTHIERVGGRKRDTHTHTHRERDRNKAMNASNSELTPLLVFNSKPGLLLAAVT